MAVPFLKEIGLVLFVAFCILMFVGSMLLVRRAAKQNKDLKNLKVYNVSMAIFVLFLAIAYAIRIYFMFFIPNTDAEFIELNTSTERSAAGLPSFVAGNRVGLIQVLWQWHMGLIFTGIGFLMFATEYLMFKKTHYLLTVIAFVTAPLILIFPYDLAHKVYFVMYIAPVLWLLVYIMVAKNTAGSLRKNAVMLIVGVLIFILGVFLNSDTVRGWLFGESGLQNIDLSAIFSVWISPVVLIIGLTVTIMAIYNKF
nr:hypothetical protein [Candidatus Sigynarchaeota archaeon]